jgi:RNA polymerase sigma-70 factor (ECF subfamily)
VANGTFVLNVGLIAALQPLPADERAVVFLREVLQWDAHDVAELLGTSAESIDATLRRARTALASMYGLAWNALLVRDRRLAADEFDEGPGSG